MKITLTETIVRTSRKYDVSGVPDLPKRYSTSTVLRPSKVTVEFKDRAWSRVYVSGPKVLKNDRLSEFTTSTDWSSWDRDVLPDWLKPLTEWEQGSDEIGYHRRQAAEESS